MHAIVTPPEWLALLVDKAPALRAAGVTSLDIHGDRMSVRLAPYEPPDPAAPRDDGQHQHPAEPGPERDPLDDPETFGGGVDGAVPGYPLDDEEHDA